MTSNYIIHFYRFLMSTINHTTILWIISPNDRFPKLYPRVIIFCVLGFILGCSCNIPYYINTIFSHISNILND